MNEDDPHGLEGVLLYLYTWEYPEWPFSREYGEIEAAGQTSKVSQKSIVPKTFWETHLAIFILADKLGIKRLKKEAQTKLQEVMDTEWTVSNFHELLQQLWELGQSGSDDLRKTALQVVTANAADLLVKDSFRDHLKASPIFSLSMTDELVAIGAAQKKQNQKRRTELRNVLKSWSRSNYAGAANENNVQSLLDNWDRP